jgi:hypothetical protein
MVNKKKKSGGLAKRYSSSYGSRDGGNSSKGGVINYRNYDGEITFFSPTEGKHRINIIPYTIKSKNHPLVKRGEAEIGEQDYIMDFYVHRGVGPSEKSVLCLKNTYGKPCPICEYAASLRKKGKEEEAKALKPSRRAAYNIEDLKEPGKLKVFETSHYLFEKELIEEARDDEEGGFIDFADPEEGMEIKFRASKTTKGNMEFTEFKSFAFEDRDEPISKELLDAAISFDELLTVPTYEEVEKILYGDDEEEDSNEDDEEEDSNEDDEEEDSNEDDEKSSKKSKSKSEPEDEDNEDKKSSKKSKSKPELEDDEKSNEDADEEEEKKPAKKPSKKSKSDDDDEDEDSNEDDEPEEKPAKKSSKKDCKGDCPECPFKHKFGKDCDEYDECDDCDIWDKCVKASE